MSAERLSAETAYGVLRRAVERWPEHGMLCAPPMAGRAYHPAGIELSYAEVWHRVEALRERYAAAGYRQGHRVALLLEQRPEFFLHSLALNALGVSIVPVNPEYRHDEMLYQMSHSGASLAVSVESRSADLERVAAERATPLPVVSLEAFPDELPPPAAAAPGGVPGIDSECILLYTSGTTGRPKGCVLSNGYYVNAGEWYTRLGGRLRLGAGDRVLNPLPLYHMNCQAMTAIGLFLIGGCLILPDRFHPGTWWRDLIATRASAFHYLGVIPALLIKQAAAPEECEHAVRFGVGAGVDPEIHAAFERRFGMPLLEVWGMTETGRILCDCHEPRRIDTRAFGRPLPGLEARVVDEADAEVERGQAGELVVRHSAADPRRYFFCGYLGNAAATEEAWRGGWFHTGDTVRQGEDGMLHFVDRSKHLIRRSGENIAAAEVEACLQAHEQVSRVAVIAAPDELRDQEVLACVVPLPGLSRDEAGARALFAWCYARLAYYKAPAWVLFVERLPTTGTQKIQKSLILAPGEDPRERPGIHDLRALKKR